MRSGAFKSTVFPLNRGVDYSALRACSLFLLDMDGTLWLGDELLPGARELVHTLTQTGRRVVYLTNNSSRAAPDYVRRLQDFGFPCRAGDVFTSGMATAMYLREHYPGAPLFVVGTPALHGELEGYGLRLQDCEESVVVLGFDRTLNYEKLTRAVHLLRCGAPYVAANPDLVCPLAGGEVLPDCGSIAALLKAATGREPTFIGKPSRRMVELVAEREGVAAAQVCCVGDRLYTDMAAAYNAGAVSALVLSGETTPAMLREAERAPDYVFEDAAALRAALLG